MIRLSPGQLGALCAVTSALFITANDSVIKFLSGGYALHQIVLIRSVLGLIITMSLIAPFYGGLSVLRTGRLREHLFRGFCVFVANIAFFLGLAVLPLAEATAIFFVAPILITLFSILFLGETVGPWRWAAIVIGFAGVVVIVRPGTGAFQFASLLPIVAAIAYAAMHTMTRRLGATESAVTLSIYIQLVFIGVSLMFGAVVGHGKYAVSDDAAIQFLLRAWAWPAPADYVYFIMIGFGVAIGGFLISQAYRVAPAAYVAPFEYVALPLAIVFGIIVFGEYPDALSYLGMALILGAGGLTIWREAVNAN